ncbi:HAD family hydrolase [Nonomuraea diastatica]|uniref:HAD family hydrolase n=1 Tax=Nonomuraea diastatica TaxID=1848329 RepID=A0A4R4WHR4_9ACTN|nr:HAD-IA family hydrolase [Nonomuraea diastatica]TDD15095.1 HAD family hydrolase [Nonomuraea diastatica]
MLPAAPESTAFSGETGPWLVLDVDDTLVDTYKTGWAKCQEVARVLELEPPDELVFAGHYGHMGFAECVQRLHTGVDLARYVSAYDALADQIPPVPLCDARRLVQAATSAGMRCGILTNGPAVKTWRKLSACGLDVSAFEFVVHGDNAAEPKPRAGSFTALKDRGVDPRRAWYVADSAAEWRAAEAAGFRTVGVFTGRPVSCGHLPTLLLPSSAALPDIAPLLAAVTGPPCPQPPAAITFDAGFTLIEHIRDPARVVRDHLARSGSAPPMSEVRAAMARATDVLTSPDSWWADPFTAESTLRRFYGDVLAGLGDASRSGAASVLDAYTDPGNWRPMPGAREILATARGSGQRIGVLSNWQPSLVNVLASTGLDRYVDVVIASTTAGVAKPSPAAFLMAAEALGVGAERLLHVGDRLVDDVLGALRAGCRAALAAEPLRALSAAFRLPAG